jgi:hypothetical protein
VPELSQDGGKESSKKGKRMRQLKSVSLKLLTFKREVESPIRVSKQINDLDLDSDLVSFLE